MTAAMSPPAMGQRAPLPVQPAARVFLRADLVLDRFATLCGAPIAELAGPSQTRDIVRLRHEAAYLMRVTTTASLTQIGKLLGGRNMATIDEGIDKVTLRAAGDRSYREYLGRLLEQIATPDKGRPAEAPRLTAARGILADPALTDADARAAALQLLQEPRHGA